MSKTITVSLVDDEADLREHISGYLQAAGGFKCKSVYASAEEALQHLPQDKPDVVLMDINLGGMDGIECVRQLKTLMPEAMKLAEEIAANPRDAVWQAKRLLHANAVEADLRRVVTLESYSIRERQTEPDHREAVTAFVEKREPRFNQG